METWRRLPTWGKWAIGVVAFLVVVIGIGGAIEGEDDHGEPRQATTTNRSLSASAEWRQMLREAAPDGARIFCRGQKRCDISYDIGELAGISIDLELMLAQRDVWSALFSNPQFQRGSIELEAPTESIGGKDLGSNPVLRVRCDRAANNLIDWEVVDADGLRKLCVWTELIDF